ncbi:hypothetical protein [Polynucleobacter sp. Nonnen-W13]|uniref:hypothetical protein n=1 Tax=Polynucleobacter sp. Nonnen-W13 TaxID=1855625 RepID=UPI001C0DFC9F|nr:hypothetical protein [Polynucleobacter sp. Nonnen-W13]MBU3558525.1 class I SAM-dependent methyltransferase [Polynucleobacter sp. Nonnen-W13]
MMVNSKSTNPLIEYLEQNPNGRVVHRWRHYFDIYHRHFSRFRGESITMIEIGIFNGGSLRMWKDYFGPKATIVGVDINPGCKKYEETGIEIVIGDQADPKFLQELSNRYPNFSVVIDDGGHRMEQQITTLEELYLPMQNDGVYLCEDTHTSYMPSFGGGHQKKNTFIEYSKKLIDQLNAFHIEESEYLAQNYFTQATDSIHFYDSVVVIEKKSRTKPDQVIYGTQADFSYLVPSLSGKNT